MFVTENFKGKKQEHSFYKPNLSKTESVNGKKEKKKNEETDFSANKKDFITQNIQATSKASNDSKYTQEEQKRLEILLNNVPDVNSSQISEASNESIKSSYSILTHDQLKNLEEIDCKLRHFIPKNRWDENSIQTSLRAITNYECEKFDKSLISDLSLKTTNNCNAENVKPSRKIDYLKEIEDRRNNERKIRELDTKIFEINRIYDNKPILEDAKRKKLLESLVSEPSSLVSDRNISKVEPLPIENEPYVDQPTTISEAEKEIEEIFKNIREMEKENLTVNEEEKIDKIQKEGRNFKDKLAIVQKEMENIMDDLEVKDSLINDYKSKLEKQDNEIEKISEDLKEYVDYKDSEIDKIEKELQRLEKERNEFDLKKDGLIENDFTLSEDKNEISLNENKEISKS